jgi:hypothetical protein
MVQPPPNVSLQNEPATEVKPSKPVRVKK